MIALAIISTPEYMNIPPLSLLYVGGALKKAGHEVQVFHVQSDRIKEEARKIAGKDPLFVGISVFTGNQTRFSAELSREIRKANPETPIVWGGIHPSLVPKQTLSEEYIDFIICGEGEEAIVELAGAIEKKKGFKSIRNLGWKKNGRLHFNPERPFIKNLDDYRLDWDLVDIRDYYLHLWDCRRVVKFITSRGCPYNCKFCFNMKFNRSRWRCHSIDFAVSEIQKLKDQYNVDGIGFYDDNLFTNYNRAVDIIERMDLPWAGNMHIKELSRQKLDRFRKLQCRELVFGLESGSNRVLRLIGKYFTAKDCIDGVKLLSEYQDIRVGCSFILGLPTETWQEIGKTIDLFLKLTEIHPRIGYTMGVYLPYPGTELYEVAVKRGFKPPSRTEDWYVLDRWKNLINPVWMEGTREQKRARNFFLIRKYAQMVAMRHLNIPILNAIPKWRLKNRNFTFPIEQPLLSWLQQKFSQKDTYISRLMHKAVSLSTQNRLRQNREN